MDDSAALGNTNTMAGPEPEMPAARAPLTKASLANRRPSASFVTLAIALPFIVSATKSCPSCTAVSAC